MINQNSKTIKNSCWACNKDIARNCDATYPDEDQCPNYHESDLGKLSECEGAPQSGQYEGFILETGLLFKRAQKQGV